MATQCCSFELHNELDGARAGHLDLTHGRVPTPAFMPVGTRAAVRCVSSSDLVDAGASMVLANTYHLWVRPGHELIRDAGGLHRFMRWDGPILTDSGGYQVFSMRDRLKVTEQGARIRSPEDGNYRMLTPETAIEVQESLGVDVAMAFDECLEWPADRPTTVDSTARTTRWLKRCLAARRHADRTAVFGIVQGGMYEDLRRDHADELAQMDLDGYAVGGLSVGEGRSNLLQMTAVATEQLPRTKVRYLMGVGHPIDIVEAVCRGIDLFDCVLPTRAGRHGQAYTDEGRLNLRNARFKSSEEPIQAGCPCPTCSEGYSRGYLRHLQHVGEMLGARLITLHNLHFYQRLMADLRAVIQGADSAQLQSLRERAAQASEMSR